MHRHRVRQAQPGDVPLLTIRVLVTEILTVTQGMTLRRNRIAIIMSNNNWTKTEPLLLNSTVTKHTGMR